LKGTLCAALNTKDGKWYRAKVLATLGQGQLSVAFIDYGNSHTVNTENLRKLHASLLQYEPCAKRCTLAYMRVPRKDKFQGAEADRYLRKYGLDKVHDAIIVEEANGLLEVILVEEGEPDWSTSINAFMISEGLGSLDQEALTEDTTPEEVLEW
jgi:hypothetical protein